MALSYTGRVNLNITGTYTNDGAVGNDVTQTVTESISKTITSGTGADQCNRYIKKTGTVDTSADTVIDCSGTTTDDFGTTTDLSEVMCILVKNTGVTNNLILGGEANSITWLAADIIIPPEGFVVLYTSASAGMPVTAATGDLITVTAAANTTTYEVSVWGRA